MTVELFYIAGCPSWERALENLEEALRREGVRAFVQTVLVPSVRDVQTTRFLGSPTIRIDGVDLEGPESDQRPVMFGCRIYRDEAHTAGWPSVEVIRRALQRAATRR